MTTLTKFFQLTVSQLSFRCARWTATFFVVTVALLLTTCKKDNIVCTDDETFCSFVNAQNFDGTGQIIDKFLATLSKNDDKSLDKLVDWLDCKSCVKKAKILCNSCIYTLPPQSEIQVKFKSNGQTVKRTLDISMGDTLKFVRYH